MREEQFDLETRRFHPLAGEKLTAALNHFEHGHAGKVGAKAAMYQAANISTDCLAESATKPFATRQSDNLG